MTKGEVIQKTLEQMEETAQTVDGLDEAIVGLGQHFTAAGILTAVIYDAEKCVEILAQDMKGDDEDEKRQMAQEYFDFNILNAYHGPTTPIFVRRIEILEEEL